MDDLSSYFREVPPTHVSAALIAKGLGAKIGEDGDEDDFGKLLEMMDNG